MHCATSEREMNVLHHGKSLSRNGLGLSPSGAGSQRAAVNVSQGGAAWHPVTLLA